MKTICDWDNCNNLGEFRAPVEKDNSKKYRMLCLEHIKEFNKNWNYFEGMDDDQLYEFIKSDMTWHKPTQSFNSSDNFFKILWNNALKDDLKKYKINGHYDHMEKFKFNNNDIKAFSILGISIFSNVIFCSNLFFTISVNCFIFIIYNNIYNEKYL